MRLWHKCFHVKLAKIIRTSFLQNTSGQLLLFQDVNLLAANTCQHYHCVNRVQIESFFWTVFSCIRTEYGDLLRKWSTILWIHLHDKKSKLWIFILSRTSRYHPKGHPDTIRKDIPIPSERTYLLQLMEKVEMDE